MDIKYFDFDVDILAGEGIILVSEVANPAHGEGFYAFSEDETSDLYNFSKNEVEMKMCGPILKVDKYIWRKDVNGYGKFSAEVAKKAHENWMSSGDLLRGNIEHGKLNTKSPTYWSEVWTVEDPSCDKSNLYGYIGDKAPSKGDIFGIKNTYNNDEGKKYWKDYIESGKVKGFSIEFDPKSLKIKETEMEMEPNFAAEAMSEAPVAEMDKAGTDLAKAAEDIQAQADTEKPNTDSEFIKKEEIDGIIKLKVSEALVDLSTRFDALETKLNDMMMEKNKLAEENALLQTEKEAEAASFSAQINELKSTIPGNFSSNKQEVVSQENMSSYQKYKEEMKKWKKN